MNEEPLNRKIESDFTLILNSNRSFKNLLLSIFVEGTAYIIGGYIRGVLNNTFPRDIDVIVDIDHNSLLSYIEKCGLSYEINRHKGIKLLIKDYSVDIWSIENNWAFKKNLVKLNDDDKMQSIAKGCFYNYDALVVNIHNWNYNIRYYNDFINSKRLDILQKSPEYKTLNPTTEANVLRAFYLKQLHAIDFSDNLKEYIIKSLGKIKDVYGDSSARLKAVLNSYPKYSDLLLDDIIDLNITQIKKELIIKDQFLLDI